MAEQGKHTYLQSHQLSGPMLSFDLAAEDAALAARAAGSASGRSSKTLVKQGPVRVTLITLAKGAKLPTHKADGPVTIHVLRGRMTLETPNGAATLADGDLSVLGTGVPHVVAAQEDSAFLLTVCLP